MGKKWLCMLMTLWMALSLTACNSDKSGTAPNTTPQTAANPGLHTTNSHVYTDDDSLTIGVVLYDLSDSFVVRMGDVMKSAAAQAGATMDIVDAGNQQSIQNVKVDQLITKGLYALIINPVDGTSVAPMLRRAKTDNLPVVFVGRKPNLSDLTGYDKTWYVGAKAEEYGAMAGEILAEYWTKHPEADRNRDGKMQYILITGAPLYEDARLYQESVLEALLEHEIVLEAVAPDTQLWSPSSTAGLLSGLVDEAGLENIDAILANSDDLALLAVEALQAKGCNTGLEGEPVIPVVGIGGTAQALEAVEKGEMLGTVFTNVSAQGTVSVNIAVAAAQGLEILPQNLAGFSITEDCYVWIPCSKITAENVSEFIGK